MQLYGALIMLMTLSAACGLKCYSCTLADKAPCTQITSCASVLTRCYSLQVNGNTVSTGCQMKQSCVSPFKCCEGDLCNSAVPTGPKVILLMVSTALFTLVI